MTVAFGPSSCSRRRATSSFARVMSTETWSWKTGICHASVRRRAIVLRMFVSSRRSTSPGAAARRRSCGRGRPHLRPLDVLGDDPALRAGARQRRELDSALAGDPAGERRRLDPAAVLRRLLPRLGDLLCSAAAALALLFARRAGRAFFLRILVDLLRGARAVAADDGSGACSPSSPMNAIVSPTGTSPSATAIRSSTPEASASTSCVTLSVSSS